MMTISTPGKLMLFGEHAVVYGHPCIVTAVSNRLEVSLEKNESKNVTVHTPGVKDTRFVDQAVSNACQAFAISPSGFSINTKSDFSNAYGFGSSAAVTVGVIAAIAQAHEKRIDKKTLFDLSYKTVLDVQGVGSGFDVAAAVYGGTLLFAKKGETLDEITMKDEDAVSFIVGYSGVKADTVSIVNNIAKKREQYKERVDRIFTAMEDVVGKGKKAMEEGEWDRVGTYMNFNHEYLRDLGVSTEKLESLIAGAKKAGAYGAKLSGAGGGDCMIAVTPVEKKNLVEEAIIRAGGEVIPVFWNEKGVGVKTTDDEDELFIVVDENDHEIGYRTRRECHRDKALIHRVVGAVIYDDANRVLLQKRSMTKDMEPGAWGISSAGHVLKGEENDEAMQRELKEELGISIPLTWKKKFVHKGKNETEMCIVYEGRYNGLFSSDKGEVSEVRFFTKDELLQALLKREVHLASCAHQTLKEVGFL